MLRQHDIVTLVFHWGLNFAAATMEIHAFMPLTGFDNIKLAEFCSPPLTTVHIPREHIGHIIFDNVLGADRGA